TVWETTKQALATDGIKLPSYTSRGLLFKLSAEGQLTAVQPWYPVSPALSRQVFFHLLGYSKPSSSQLQNHGFKHKVLQILTWYKFLVWGIFPEDMLLREDPSELDMKKIARHAKLQQFLGWYRLYISAFISKRMALFSLAVCAISAPYFANVMLTQF